MQLGKMKYTVVFLLFIALIETALAATCTYYRSSNRITCGSVTCRTRSPPWWSGGKLPAGYYYIGDYGYKGTWFKLYRQRVAGGYWDYHSRVPELTCRGGFALHPGTYSRGCITVSDNNCYNRLKNVITRYPAIWFSVHECSIVSCLVGSCPTNNISRLCTTDLEAV